MNDVPLVRLLSMAVSVGLDALHAELAAAGHGTLRPAHGYALNAILDGQDTASQVAPRLGMTKQGAAKLLQTLVDEGYVEQGPGADDARRRPFVLTRRGREAVELSVRIQHQIEQRWRDSVGERRMGTTRRTLEQVVRSETAGELPPVRPSW
jgi:DNA-binding MarR family transcriptional regulator